jgi:CBS domain-containing protein
MTVESILRRKGPEVVTIAPDSTIKRAADIMREHDISALVVTNHGELSGVITERDIARGFSRHGGELALMRVREIMTRAVVTISKDDDVKQVMVLMTRHRVRHLPVVEEDGALAGIVSIGDVVKYRLDDLELERAVLRDAWIAAH